MIKSDIVNRWLTLAANLGVLVGLLLLVAELNQNSELLRAQIHQARSDTYEAFVVDGADTQYFLPAWEKFRSAGGPENVAALDTLTPIELARVSRYLQGRLGGYDNLFFQYKNGYLDEEFYQTRVVQSIRDFVPIYSKLGLLRPSLITPSFLAEIERIRSSD